MNTIKQALEWANAHAGKPFPAEHCQEMARTAYGVQAWADSAKHAWEKTPGPCRHSIPAPPAVPAGALVYYDIGQFGHVALSMGHGLVLTTDYCKTGTLCVADIHLPHWKPTLLGYSYWTPFGNAH